MSAAVRFSATSVDALAASGIKYDVVLANIHAPVLADMAASLTKLVAPRGWLGLSGLSPAQVSRLIAAFPAMAFEPPTHLDDWTALVATRLG